MVSNLALFCLATFGQLFKKMGDFFPNHLVTLQVTYAAAYYAGAPIITKKLYKICP
jgi:hypothetical protein